MKGELKIRGYSSYIHPLDAGKKLLTVGDDADLRGRVLGAQLQVFDVSDLTRPKRIYQHRVKKSAGAKIQNDHHVFTFDPTAKLLALPIVVKGQTWRKRKMLLVFNVDSGFSELGRIHHGDLLDRCRRDWWSECVDDVAVQRSVVIEDHLYSLSRAGLKVHRIKDLAQRAALSF